VHFKQIMRTNPITGRMERPWRNRDSQFVLGDPAKGDVRHHDTHAVKVDNYGEALELVEEGFSIRMSDGKNPASLVTPASLTFVDEPVSVLDELWTFSMPDAPFSREELERDIRRTILIQAGEIYWLANSDAADAFVGFPLEIDEVEHGGQEELLDLSRFNFARVVLNAYEGAFRTGIRPLTAEDADELEMMIGAVTGGRMRRYPSPSDRPGSALRQTMLSAYLRWKMSEGALFDNKLDQSAVESLAVLAGMSEQAVRNSLNKEGLSPVRGKLDYDAVIRWLEQRRDFVPLREDERPEARLTWEAIHLLRTVPLRDAFKEIRDRDQRPRDRQALDSVEELLARTVEQGGEPRPSDLRAYARLLGFAIDTFVLNFGDAVSAAPSR
jgi:hypothetical protein